MRQQAANESLAYVRLCRAWKDTCEKILGLLSSCLLPVFEPTKGVRITSQGAVEEWSRMV